MNTKKALVLGGAAVGAYWLWRQMGTKPTTQNSGFAGLTEDVEALKLKYLELNEKYNQVYGAMSPDLEKLDQAGYKSQIGIYNQISDEGLAAYKAMKGGDLVGASQLYKALIVKVSGAINALQVWVNGMAGRAKAYQALQDPGAKPASVFGSNKTLVVVAAVAAGLGLFMLLRRKKSAASTSVAPVGAGLVNV